MNIVQEQCDSRKDDIELQQDILPCWPELGLSDDDEEYLEGDDRVERKEVYRDSKEMREATTDTTERLSPLSDARSGVEAWKIAKLGRRPQDFMGRDLLLNSLWRDERPRVFHNLVKKPPVWIEDHVSHLSGSENQQAVQLTALHYLHRRQLTQLWSGTDAGEGGGNVDSRILTQLETCWPYGAIMLPPENADTNLQHCCRFAWLCPWCYARRTVALNQLLREGPLRQPQGKHLVLASLATFGEQASPDPEWIARWSGRASIDDYYLQSPGRVRTMRSAVTSTLQSFARALNITGGIITHQISPWKTGYYRKGTKADLLSFRHDYALLGEVTFRDEEEISQFRDATAYRSNTFGALSICHPDLSDCYNSPSVFWSFHPADDPNIDTLRLLLAGSSTNYPVGKLEGYAGGIMNGRLVRNGVRGALALQPHFMMDRVQWQTYAEATRGLPLYVPFGTWRNAIGEVKRKIAERRQLTKKATLSKRTPDSQRWQSLKEANDQRSRIAQLDLDRLVDIARPLLKQALTEPANSRGRPAYRSRLKELLKEQNCLVSDHHLKQIIKKLLS